MYSQLNEKNLSADRLYAADALSSMANGVEESSTSVPCSSIEGLTSGIPTLTTSTLTPTTLKNIEDQFLELNPIPTPLEHTHQAGFAPPMISFSTLPKHEDNRWVDECMHSSDRSIDSPRPPSEASSCGGSRPARTGRSGGRRPAKDEKLSPEEEERRRIRRERNKLAAARCRKRRMELTSNLMNETDGLEEKRQSLQHEIQALSNQKEELEFILEAHKATCKLAPVKNSKVSISESKPTMIKFKSSYCRPTSLPLSLSSSYNGVNEALKPEPGSSLNTPSIFQLEQLMEGGGSTNGGFMISSCGGQQRSSGSDLSSPDTIAPPKLVSL